MIIIMIDLDLGIVIIHTDIEIIVRIPVITLVDTREIIIIMVVMTLVVDIQETKIIDINTRVMIKENEDLTIGSESLGTIIIIETEVIKDNICPKCLNDNWYAMIPKFCLI